MVYDWLEDSLTGRRKKVEAVRGYTLDRTLTRIRTSKKDYKKFRGKSEDSVRVSKELFDHRKCS